MKRSRSTIIVFIGVIVIFSAAILSLGIIIYRNWLGIQSTLIDGRPAEQLMNSVLSSDGLHKLDVYHNSGKGATVAESAVVIISANEGGVKWQEKSSWCLYYVYAYSDITAAWIDNENVIIHNTGIQQNDGYITLNIYQNEYAHENATQIK